MDDYLSKRTLTAILLNWAVLDLSYLQKVKSIFLDYWEPDLFPANKDDVLVDVGAYTGDSIAQYVQIYGKGYKRIYAYEVSPESCAAIHSTIMAQGHRRLRQPAQRGGDLRPAHPGGSPG